MAQIVSAAAYQPGYSQMANAIIQADNGDYILAGRLFDESGKSYGVALRADPSGAQIWENTYGGQYSSFFSSIAEIGDGSLVAAGTYFYSNMAGDEYLWVVKLDPDGRKIWEKTLGGKKRQNDGYSVAATPDGGFIVTGLRLDKRQGGAPATWVLKFGGSGELQWDKVFDAGVAYAVIPAEDGGYALAGAHNLPGSLNSNVYVLRLDADGRKIWERIYPDFQVYVLLRSGIAQTRAGNFVVAAKSVLMEISPDGDAIWAHQDERLALQSIAFLPRGSYAVGGSLIANNFDHAYIAVLSRRGGKIIWDNTEILYPSGLAQVLASRDGLVASGGYGPLDANRSTMFMAVFSGAKAFEEEE